uniref:Orc1-like AAA ATPase domain-containing protein n=1 Tax=Palpitomonas bilix TaxID=652834 RepID=A0A7S3DIZ9_9EUKA
MAQLRRGFRSEVFAHNAFMYEKERMYIDVSSTRSAWSEVDEFLQSTSCGVCLVNAQSGAGKSSFLAKLASTYQQKESQAVYTRFCGTTPLTSTSKDVLISLIEELKESEVDEEAEENEMEKMKNGTLKEVRDSLFRTLSTKNDKSIIIVIDALDKLKDGSIPFWLVPSFETVFPAGVHVVASFIPDVTNTEHVEKYFSSHTQQRESMDTASAKLLQVTLPVLDTLQDKEMIIRHHLLRSDFPRKADEIELPAIATPLHLTLAALHAVFPIHLNGETQAGESVMNLVLLFFQKLEVYHGEVLVRKAFQYLNIAKEGLAAIEWEDLLSLDEEVKSSLFGGAQKDHATPPRLPGYVIQHILRSLEGLIQTSGREGYALYRWFHRQFWEGAAEKYRADADALRTFASYFSSKSTPEFGVKQEVEVGGKYNVRRGVELFPACFSLCADHADMSELEDWACSISDIYLVCHCKVWSGVVSQLSSLPNIESLRKEGGRKRAVYDVYRLLLSSGNEMEGCESVASMCRWVEQKKVLPSSCTVLTSDDLN